MARKCLLAAIAFSLALLPACSRPAPTPDTPATKAALAAAVEATLTAMAPSATPTAVPSATPIPTPEAPPAVVPDDWVAYTALSGAFTFYHPADWKVGRETADAVSFELPEEMSAAFLISVGRGSELGGYGASRDDDALLGNLAANVASAYKPEDKFRVTVKKMRDDGPGYLVEGTYEGTGIAEGTPAYRVWVLAILPRDLVAVCSYAKAGQRRIPQAERETFYTVLGSLRVGADPAPRVTPVAGPRPTVDPVTEIAEFKAVVSDLLSLGIGSDRLVTEQVEALRDGRSDDHSELAARARFAAEKWDAAESGFLGFETSNPDLQALIGDLQLYARYRTEAYDWLARWAANDERELDVNPFREKMALSDKYLEAALAKLDALPGDR